MTNDDRILAGLGEILATQREALANQEKAIAAQQLAITRQASHIRLYRIALIGVAVLITSLIFILLKIAGPYLSLS